MSLAKIAPDEFEISLRPTPIRIHNPIPATFLIAVLFTLLIAPTFISYKTYHFAWDESDYFARSIAASRAFWAGDVKGLGAAMVSIRPPIMTLMGLPWGPLRTWKDAGKCFITLATAIALMATTSLYLLLRIGIKPIPLVLAAAIVCLSIGPIPPKSLAHACATGFLADILFSWIVLTACLLIPFEARAHPTLQRDDIFRGLTWGAVLSLGTMTKLNFLYFVALVTPILIFIRWRRQGSASAIRTVIAWIVCSLPCAFYLLRYGHLAFDNLTASSFGSVAGFYNKPLSSFIQLTIKDSPGMAVSFIVVIVALICWMVKNRIAESWPDLAALAIMLGFSAIVFGATNKQIRYAFPAVISLPFLTGLLFSHRSNPISRKWAVSGSSFVFCALLIAGIPMRGRPDAQSLDRCNAVLAAARQLGAHQILLATDSPNLNSQLMELAALFSQQKFSIGTLAYQAMYGLPLSDDLRAISATDLVVFQDRAPGSPQFTNERVGDYEAAALKLGALPERIGSDLYVYRVPRRNSSVLD